MGRLGKIAAAIAGLILILAMLLMVVLTFTHLTHGGPAWQEFDSTDKAYFVSALVGMGLAAGALLYLSSRPTPSKPPVPLRHRE